MFYVVEFSDTQDVAVIPSSWLVGRDEAVWPNSLSTTRINNPVAIKELPKPEWKKYSKKIMYESDLYEKTRKNLKEAEYHSDVQTNQSSDSNDEVERPRRSKRKRKPKRYTSSESSEESGRGLKTRKSVLTSSSDSDEGISRKTTKAKPVPLKASAPSLTSAKVTPPHETPSTSNLVESQPQSPNESITATRLSMVLEELRTVHVKINTLLRNSSIDEEDQGTLEGIHFPLNDKKAIASLELKLRDPREEKKVIAHFSVIGGANFQDTVRRILRYAVTNSLAMQYNWCGKGEKESFGILKLKDTIIKSVRKHPDYKHKTAASVEFVMKEWFRTARDREGGRRRRDQSARH